MLIMKMFNKPSRFIVLSIVSLCFICSNANAVIFDGNSLAGCYDQKDTNSAVGSITLDFYLCEDFNFFHAIFVGDFVDQGDSVDFDWEGEYWDGSVELARSLNVDNKRQLLASGTARHLTPDVAPTWEFEDLVGGGTGIKTLETLDGVVGFVPHDDAYSATLRLDEGRALFNEDPNPMPFERGFLLEVKGRHGNGPFCIEYAASSAGGGCNKFAAPNFFQVPVPASMPLVLVGLVGLCVTRNKKPGVPQAGLH
ncbi:MAG: hypothetical protein KUG79_17960 [Pseudomonadales bacterium]|nr:hypothetical protein [Pseudomonadales bacterium]